MNFLEKFFPLCGLLLIVRNGDSFRCGKISYRKPKMEAWMSLKHTFFGMFTSLHLAMYSPLSPPHSSYICSVFPFLTLIFFFFLGSISLGLQYNFEGRYDLVRFIKTVQKAGLYAQLRIGPYVCAEWNFGYFLSRSSCIGLTAFTWKLTVFSVSGFLLLYFPLICCFPSIFIAWALDLK